MRLKLTLRGDPPRDVIVTCEASASVGDVASRLAGFHGRGRGPASLTLQAQSPGALASRLLNPLLPLHDAGLRSGAVVELAEFKPREVPLPKLRAVVEIVSGPDAGARTPLGPGLNFIGRDPAAHVVLTDSLVSRRHASVHVGAQTVVSDLNSVNGVEVDGVAIDRVIVTGRSVVRVGDTTLRIEPIADEGAVDGGDLGFTRSPRVSAQWVGEDLPAPALPRAGEKPRLPWIALAAPVVAGVALFALTRNPLMLLFIALSPVMMLGSWIDQRVRHRRQRRDESERFRAGLDALRTDLMQRRESERSGRLAEAPAVAEVAQAIRSRDPLLWTRLPEHASFLALRLGAGTLASRTHVQLPGRQLDGGDEWALLNAVVEEFSRIEDVPVVERLADAGAIGVAGRDTFAPDLARALVLQVAGLHSPAQVAVAAFAAADAADDWEWLKWLPHVDSPHHPLTTSLAADLSSSARMLAELEALIATRRGVGGSATVRSHLDAADPAAVGLWEPVQRSGVMPAVVVVIAGEPAVERGRLVQVAQDGPDVGVYTIWLAEDASRLPVVCRTFVDVGAASGAVSFVRHGTVVPLASLELASSILVAECAHLLAPLEDDGAPVLDESDLPRSVSFLGLFDDDIANDPDAVSARWARGDSLVSAWTPGVRREPGGLGGVLGVGANGAMRIDLRRDGPHALVGGTTGAGKSEFLQTWILGMAVENAPDRLTFLLVDYKGGSAFGHVVDLPHTVGLVTDLTPPLVKRALMSLRAEIKRRELLLAEKGSKDLLTLEERGDPSAPPALVIVIDEFAALAGEVPEFVDGIVDIAQRGRSLGIHVIMATQRPAGVIKDNLRANTNLRIGLRMADEADSQDVLGIDRAARFDPDTPGRAAAKLGAGTVRDFQTAYAGGRSTRQRSVEIEVREFPFAPAATWPVPTSPTSSGGEARDIELLVSTIRRASDALRLRTPRRPWLDALPSTVDVAALPQTEGRVLGLSDEPSRQRQTPFVLDLDAMGSVAVFGTVGVGKSTLLRTIAVGESSGEHPAWIYAIDATGALGGLAALPTCGAVISLTDRERVVRLFSMLEEQAASRSKLLAGASAATLAEFNRGKRHHLPRILVMIDSISAFRSEYEFDAGGRLFDGFTQLVSAGRQVGIHFLLTADRQAAVPQALLASIQERIVLRMAAPAEFEILGVPRGMLDDAPAGRGYAHGLEVQFALPGGETELSGQIAHIEKLAAGIVEVADPIARLEEHIPWASLPATVEAGPVFGVADDDLQPVGIPAGLFVVTGPFQSGRSTAMRTAITATLAAFPGIPSYLLSARPGVLEDAAEWTDSALYAEDADLLAARLAAVLGTEETGALIVVEASSEFEGTPAEGAVARLLKASRRNPHVRCLIETDTITAGAAWQLYTELKTARAGIVLQPEESDGAGIFRVPFPRATRADFPVGRGFYVNAGRVRRVQVALPPCPPKRGQESVETSGGSAQDWTDDQVSSN